MPLARAACTSIGMSPTKSACDGSHCVDWSVRSTCCASGLRAPATSGPAMSRKYESTSVPSRSKRTARYRSVWGIGAADSTELSLRPNFGTLTATLRRLMRTSLAALVTFTDSRQQMADSRQQTADSRRQITDSSNRRRAAAFLLSAVCCLLSVRALAAEDTNTNRAALTMTLEALGDNA